METLLSLLPALVSLLLFLVLHILLWRHRSQKGVILLAEVAAASYGIVLLALAPLIPVRSHVLVSLPVFLCCVLAYLHLYVGTFRSLSVRLLEELHRVPSRSLTLQEMDRVYSRQWMLHSRLETLEQHHWVIKDAGGYRCTPKGVMFARLILALRRLYGFKNAG